MDARPRTRMPLTVRAAQGLPPPRKMDGSKQRTYGRQGYTAASRATLKENYVGEKSLANDLIRLTVDDYVLPKDSNSTGQETTTSTQQKVRSRAAYVEKIQKHQKGALNDPKFVEYIQPLLVEGGSNEVLDFKAWANRLGKRFKIVKLAEGSFGEVFKLEEKDLGITAAPMLDAYGGCIMKVIPLNAKSGRSSKKKYSTVAEVVREVKLLKTMDEVPGFTRFRRVHVVQGQYPDSFLEAFRHFKEEGKDCENQDPAHFSSKQHFAIIEMDDAGADLESLRKPSVFQVHDIFWSTVVLLANAEERVEFEHRDLHVGNICIKPGVADGAIEIPSELVSNMSAAPKSLLGLSGIRTTIIDYTLSRATTDPEKADIIFDPFHDASMFKAVGANPEDKRQFETYRAMRSRVAAAYISPRKAGRGVSKLSQNADIWSRFVPQTNVVWLSYILHVLLFRADARIVPHSNEVAEKLQVQMYDTLEDVMDRLNVHSKTLPTSAKDLVCIAEANGWLTREDLRGLKARLEAEQEG